MACLSEISFRTADRDWSYEGQEGEHICIVLHWKLSEKIYALLREWYEKAKAMLLNGIHFFRTRRRRSYRIQDLVVKTLIRANEDFSDKGGKLVGTSNVCSLLPSCLT